GAVVAGLRAGYVFNTWPLMGNSFAPPGLASLTPLWRNAVDNPVAVQFIHRCTAYLVALYALRVAWRLKVAGATPQAAAIAGLVLLQVTLGILTVVHGVPIPVAVAHQACAALLLASTIWAAHWCWQGRRAALSTHARRLG
ncbi:MAG: COX15/CtaA family protein, partial [Janthinobacterium lividum]